MEDVNNVPVEELVDPLIEFLAKLNYRMTLAPELKLTVKLAKVGRVNLEWTKEEEK